MSIRKRFLIIACLFLKMMLDFNKEFKLVRKKGFAYAQKKMQPVHEKRARQLYDSAISLGGMVVKLCQFLSSRRDILPEPYIRILSSLQDKVPELSFHEMEKVLEEEYEDYKKIFRSVEKESLASASLGQVHRAVLFNGDEVVLKILKPGIEKVFDLDSAILFHVFKILSNFRFFKSRSDIVNVLDEFIRVTGDELNFEREIYITVPSVYKDYSRSKVIVLEFLKGDKINDIEKWIDRNNEPKLIAKRIIEFYTEQILAFGTVHYDPHPGNIFITENSNIVILDFGMSGEITEKMSDGIKKCLEGFIRKDNRMILEAINDLGFIKKGVNIYSLLSVVEFFTAEVIDVVKLEREAYYDIDFTEIMDDFVNILYSQPFVLPMEWAFIGKTIGVLIGIISMLYPDINIYDELKPHVKKLIIGNIGEISKKTIEGIKNYTSTLIKLPEKTDNFINNIERGYYKIPVDYDEIMDKVDEIKVFLVKLVSFTISSATIISSYVTYTSGRMDLALLFLIVSAVSFFVSIFYRKKTLKDKFQKYF